jgi:hypothetical protein
MPIVAQTPDDMVEIAARESAAGTSASHAQCAQRFCEALSLTLESPAHYAGLLALLLGVPNAIIDRIRVAALDQDLQTVRITAGERRLPLIACDALATSPGLPSNDMERALAARKAPALSLLRHRFADLVTLAGFPPQSALSVMRRLTSTDEWGHRACTMIDVVSLVLSEAAMPSERCGILRDAVRAVVVCGWPHGGPILLGIARRYNWNVHPKGAQMVVETLHSGRSARERLAARGMLSGMF